MKNTIIFIIFSLLFAFNTSAQEKVSIVVKGYFVYSCKKSRINFLYEQDFIKAQAIITGNKKITTHDFIDLLCGKYFVPTQVGDVKIDTNIVIDNIRQHTILDTAFIFVGNYGTSNGCLECTEKEKISIAKDNLKLSVAYKLAPYYDFGERLKRIVYIEGYAKYFDKQQDGDDLKARITFIDNDCKAFYLINKIINYSTIIDLPNLNVWYPYLENE